MIEIRKARLEDIEGIVVVNTKVWRSAYKDIINSQTLDGLNEGIHERVAYFQEEYNEAIKENSPLYQAVAIDDNKVIGFIKYGPYRNDDTYRFEHTAEIYAIYVDDVYQKRQVGEGLIDFAVQHLLDLKDYERLVIWTLKQNPSRGFYERLGGQAKFFREITIREQVLEEVGYEFELLEMLKGVNELYSNDLGMATSMRTALRQNVERQLRTGLEHYKCHANEYNFDWSESCEEGCDFDYLDGTIDRFSGIRVFNESKILIAEGWLDYVYVNSEDKLYVFWDYLNLVEGGQVKKVKTRSGIPAYIFEKLDNRTIEKCKNLNMKFED